MFDLLRGDDGSIVVVRRLQKSPSKLRKDLFTDTEGSIALLLSWVKIITNTSPRNSIRYE